MDYQQTNRPQPQQPQTLVQRVVLFWSTLGFTDVLVFRIGALSFMAVDYYYGQRFWKFFPMMIGATEPLPGVLAGAFQIGFSAVQILLLQQIYTLVRRMIEGMLSRDWERFAWFGFAVLFLLLSFAVNVIGNVVSFRLNTNRLLSTFEDTRQAWLNATQVGRWLWAGGALLVSVLGEMLWDLAGLVAQDRASSGRP